MTLSDFCKEYIKHDQWLIVRAGQFELRASATAFERDAKMFGNKEVVAIGTTSYNGFPALQITVRSGD